MRKTWETACGIWELARLAIKSRCRMRSGYWRWRNETAFGSDESKMPGRRERIRAILDYGRWVHRMRRG